jgi:hypothetical protein
MSELFNVAIYVAVRTARIWHLSHFFMGRRLRDDG